jgi:hypothetical protein
MADLQSLNEKIAAARERKAAKPAKPKPVPRKDTSVEKAVKTMQEQISGALTIGFKKLDASLQKLIKRPEPAQVNPEQIEKAVERGVAKIKLPEITFPVREPVSYKATIERRGKEMTGALIEPITGRK